MEFEIIRLIAGEKRYYPTSVDLGILDDGNYIKHDEIDIPLGKSRYGGPIIDLPPDIAHPEGLRFVCQLDLGEISKHDKRDLLPKTGQLIIFCDIMTEKGKIYYANILNEDLKRTIVEHEDNFWDGVIIEEVKAETEKLEDRYRLPEDEEEEEEFEEYLNEEGKFWDEFTGTDVSKIFGIFTHCQWGEEEIKQKISENKTVLVQFGNNGFNTGGVFSVWIDTEDLKHLNFDNCEYHWGQS
ncbi:MAG: DUF1963 domain-containing protein [Bacteroidota bacterium]